MRTATYDTPHNVRGGTKDYWRIFDTVSELADASFNRSVASMGGARWAGGSEAQAQAWARDGKVSLVAQSDALMSKLEAQAESVITPASVIVSDVSGSVANVPAYLAGHPLAMRRRARVHNERAPVCVIVDTAVSSAIGHETILKRGAAILAFVRLLSVRRPLELYSGVAGNNGDGAAYLFTRIDTAPLDLAHAAYLLCDPSATRTLGYCRQPSGYDGRWPYKRGALDVDAFKAVASQAFPHLQEFVAIPGLHLYDKLVTDPLAWILEKLAEFGEGADQ